MSTYPAVFAIYGLPPGAAKERALASPEHFALNVVSTEVFEVNNDAELKGLAEYVNALHKAHGGRWEARRVQWGLS